MKDSFIPDDLQNANESLMKKIEYLTLQKSKSDFYLKDLQQSLKINKQAVRVLNSEGPNDSAIKLLTKESQLLQSRLRKSYNQNRDLNALLLFECQIRIQDKSFYQERVVEFENRISDLRKYLHDKEDSFSHVVNRLKKYEDINELMLVDKVASLRGQFMADHQLGSKCCGNGNPCNYTSTTIKQIMAKLSEERNMYKKKYQAAMEDIRAMRQGDEKSPNEDKINNNNTQGLSRTNATNNNISVKSENSKLYPINPNKELIRLLKKEKVSNEILQQALNDAIEKNEELVSYNQRLFEANQNLQEICSQLRAYILKLQGRLADFEQNYRRKRQAFMSRCDMDLGCMKDRRMSKNFEFQDKNFGFQQVLSRGEVMKLKRDVQRVAVFMPKPIAQHQQQGKNGQQQADTREVKDTILLVKSSSEPKLSKEQMSDQQIQIDYY